MVPEKSPDQCVFGRFLRNSAANLELNIAGRTAFPESFQTGGSPIEQDFPAFNLEFLSPVRELLAGYLTFPQPEVPIRDK
jgi:hypothetical protein